MPVQGRGVDRSNRGHHEDGVNPALFGTLLSVGLPIAAKAIGSLL